MYMWIVDATESAKKLLIKLVENFKHPETP